MTGGHAGRQAYTGVPRWLYGLAVLAALVVVLPLVAMVARVNWANFIPLVTSAPALAALGLSLRTAAASTANPA